MMRQYKALRATAASGGKRIGTIPVGTILYLQRGGFWSYTRPIRRNPWIVMAWLNREYFPGVKGARSVTFMAGGHIALVKSLRDGRTLAVADHILLQASDAGLEVN